MVTRYRSLWLDQADAAAVAEGEEVTLMEWGNAVVEVRREAGRGRLAGRAV